MDISPVEMVRSILNHIEHLETAQNQLETALHAEANTDRVYRDAKHKAWGKAEGRSVDERIAHVDSMVGDERLRRDLAVANAKYFMEKVRNKRQMLSALQSAANSIKEEAAHYRVGPEHGPSLEEKMQEYTP